MMAIVIRNIRGPRRRGKRARQIIIGATESSEDSRMPFYRSPITDGAEET